MKIFTSLVTIAIIITAFIISFNSKEVSASTVEIFNDVVLIVHSDGSTETMPLELFVKTQLMPGNCETFPWHPEEGDTVTVSDGEYGKSDCVQRHDDPEPWYTCDNGGTTDCFVDVYDGAKDCTTSFEFLCDESSTA